MLKVANKKSKNRENRVERDSVAAVSDNDAGDQRSGTWATVGLGLAGAILLWAAFPPLNLPWLAWIAPVPWLWLVRRTQLPGWHPYVVLWVAGSVHWLLMLEGIRLAHPALYAGWIALAVYLGVYLPVFVGLTRVAVQRLGVSIVVAAPVVWVGLELVRGHLITGFSMGLLAHTQAEFSWLIQVSDVAGGYGLSFVVMLVAACLARVFGPGGPSDASHPCPTLRPMAWWPVVPAAAAILVMLVYGQWRISQTPPGAAGPTAHVALIQGSLDTVFVELTAERAQATFDHYRKITAEAVHGRQNLDLVLWPESMFVVSETVIEEPLGEQRGLTADEARARLKTVQEDFQTILASEAARANANTDSEHPETKFLVGTTSVVYGKGEPRVFNAALMADRSGNVVGRYYKTHPVMFGEYIPFAEALPWLNKVTPIAVGLSRGDGPRVFEVAGLKMSPSICFESTIPHLIRGQLAELARKGTPADVLVNVTNDGWFWGTAMLDLHFRCGVFRAVENRKPVLVVANTGISTFVDGSGVIRERGPRRESRAVLAEVQADGRKSPYATIGDWPAGVCAGLCVGLAVVGLWRRPVDVTRHTEAA